MYFFDTNGTIKPIIRKSTIENAHDVLGIGNITMRTYNYLGEFIFTISNKGKCEKGTVVFTSEVQKILHITTRQFNFHESSTDNEEKWYIRLRPLILKPLRENCDFILAMPLNDKSVLCRYDFDAVNDTKKYLECQEPPFKFDFIPLPLNHYCPRASVHTKYYFSKHIAEIFGLPQFCETLKPLAYCNGDNYAYPQRCELDSIEDVSPINQKRMFKHPN